MSNGNTFVREVSHTWTVHARAPKTRKEKKERTRAGLLSAALGLLEEQSFSSLGIREVAREAGVVPTTFYRHFESMEELGLALIDESFRSLRGMLREARADPEAFEHAVDRSVEVLVDHVHHNRAHFRFIARERFSGVAAIRHAIRSEIRVVTSELATDLVRFPYIGDWSNEDLRAFSGLIVNAMVSVVEEVLEAPAGSSEAEAEIKRVARTQLLMIVLSVPSWRSRKS